MVRTVDLPRGLARQDPAGRVDAVTGATVNSQDEIPVGERWTLIPGLRWEDYETHADDADPPSSEDNVSDARLDEIPDYRPERGGYLYSGLSA